MLETLPLEENSDDFVFDNQMLAQTVWFGFSHRRDLLPDQVLRGGLLHQFPPQRTYGLGVLATSLKYRLQKMHVAASGLFSERGEPPALDYYKELNA